MNTSDQPRIELTAEEAENFKKKFANAKVECAKNALYYNQKDLDNLDVILQDIQQKDISNDELTTLLHNLISIVPEEQYRFMKDIRTLYSRMPCEIEDKPEFKYAKDRLFTFGEKELSSKVQMTDLSMYWTMYRTFIYKYGLVENSKQLKAQSSIHKTMLQVIVNTVAKRTRGIESAKKFIGADERVQLEETADNNRGEQQA